MGILRGSNGDALYPVGPNVVSEATITVGTNTITVNGTGALGRNGNRGHIANDGGGDITAQITHDGTNYWTAFTIKAGESFDLTGLSVNKIKINFVSANASYRVLVY